TRAEIASPAAGVKCDRGFAGSIVGDARPWSVSTYARANRNDPSAFSQQGRGSANGGCDAADVDRKLPVDLSWALRGVVDFTSNEYARVVDEHVKAPKFFHDYSDQLRHLGGVRLIRSERCAVASLILEFLNKGFGFVRRGHIAESHVCPVRCQAFYDCRTN